MDNPDLKTNLNLNLVVTKILEAEKALDQALYAVYDYNDKNRNHPDSALCRDMSNQMYEMRLFYVGASSARLPDTRIKNYCKLRNPKAI